MARLDKEIAEKYAVKWNVYLIEGKNLPSVTGKDGKEWKKAEILVCPEGWPITNSIWLGCFGYTANVFLDDNVNQGDKFAITWLPDQYVSNAGFTNTRLSVLSAKKLSEGNQVPTQEDKNIAAVKMVAPDANIKPSLSQEPVQESDFDFETGETVPF